MAILDTSHNLVILRILSIFREVLWINYLQCGCTTSFFEYLALLLYRTTVTCFFFCVKQLLCCFWVRPFAFAFCSLLFSILLILISRNNHKLHSHLIDKLQLSSCAPSLSAPSCDTSSTYSHVVQSSPCMMLIEFPLHLLPFHRLCRPKGSVGPDLMSRLTPCLGLLMFLLCVVLLNLCRSVGLLLLRNL